MPKAPTLIVDFVSELLTRVPFLGDHSIRVGFLSHQIAREMFDDDELVSFAAMGGLIHDIGFVIPRYVKSLFEYKSAHALLEFDRARMIEKMGHTTIGGYVLSNFLGMFEYADVAFYHHTPASELDENSFTHTVANIVNIADTVDTLLERMEISLAEEMIPDILTRMKDNFFPEIYEITIDLLNKDITWWSLENAKYHFEESVRHEMIGKGSDVDMEDLVDVGHFTAYLVDAKSPFTRKHSERIATLARDLSMEYGLGEKRAKEMYVAGLFHDIGKIAIPLNILEKPARLDENELWYMRKHVYYTEILLKGFEKVGHEWPIWARQHHERLDGKGYPRRLKGEELPLESRILQVCDVFVAFTEDRPYREPLDFSEALGILEKEVEKGKMDGDVLEKLATIIENGYTFPEKTVTEEIVETVEFLMENLG